MGFRLTPSGSFSLAAAADFTQNFPGTESVVDDGLRISWALDGDWRTVTVVLHQPADAVLGESAGETVTEVEQLARRDVERFLCLDIDGSGFDEVCERDTTLGAARRSVGGLRPVLFYTPYEAAAWTIIGQRIRMTQAAAVRRRLATDLGHCGAFPAPSVLAELTSPQHGLTDTKVGRLRDLGAAAEEGQLGRDRLREMDEDAAVVDLQRLSGVGPFSAELILIRGVGAPDRMPKHEKRIDALIADLYGSRDAEAVTKRWSPYRSWAATLLRASSGGR